MSYEERRVAVVWSLEQLVGLQEEPPTQKNIVDY
jgi:hypothetical protein